MLGIGIETSCDETAIAIVKNGKHILSNLISSQIKEHSPFYGVVPELASRAHVEKINHLFEMALKEADIQKETLDYIAVSAYPGLIGCLMVGANFAKCLHLVTRKPLYAVNHIEGHFYAPCLDHSPLVQLQYPCLGLILSGGNSAIYRLLRPGHMTIVADTLDDACGEAFDKVARILGFPYANGAMKVEQRARIFEKQHRGDSSRDPQKRKKANIFPKLLQKGKTGLSFSFSGIKTAVLHAQKSGMQSVDRICHDFQDRCFELVTSQLKKASEQTGISRIVAGGGVLANRNLKDRLKRLAETCSLEIFIPKDPRLCTDNAAMVASLGYHLHCSEEAKKWQASLTFLVSSSACPSQK